MSPEPDILHTVRVRDLRGIFEGPWPRDRGRESGVAIQSALRKRGWHGSGWGGPWRRDLRTARVSIRLSGSIIAMVGDEHLDPNLKIYRIETYSQDDTSLAEVLEAAEALLKLAVRLRDVSYEELEVALDSVGK